MAGYSAVGAQVQSWCAGYPAVGSLRVNWAWYIMTACLFVPLKYSLCLLQCLSELGWNWVVIPAFFAGWIYGPDDHRSLVAQYEDTFATSCMSRCQCFGSNGCVTGKNNAVNCIVLTVIANSVFFYSCFAIFCFT